MPLTKRLLGLVGVPVHESPTWSEVSARGARGLPEAGDRRMPNARLAGVKVKSYVEAAKSEHRVIYDVHHRRYLVEVDLGLMLRQADSVVSIRNARVSRTLVVASRPCRSSAGAKRGSRDGEALRASQRAHSARGSWSTCRCNTSQRRDEGVPGHARVRPAQRHDHGRASRDRPHSVPVVGSPDGPMGSVTTTLQGL
jgi:hypothetical protein